MRPVQINLADDRKDWRLLNMSVRHGESAGRLISQWMLH